MPSGPRVNLASANEQVPEIKRRIRVSKERSKYMRHSLPFHRIKKLMTIHAIINIGKMVNYFPTKIGVSTTMIPRAVLNGENLDYENLLLFQYR